MFRPLFVLVVLFVVIHAVLLGYSAMWHSPTPVEASTVVAGVRYWQAGQYDLYLVNPPLVPVVATLPIVLAKPETDWRQHDGHTHRPEFALGTDFIKINRECAARFFIIGRWACIPLDLAGALVCFFWVRESYGSSSGIVALILWCFSPSMLGHGQVISSDVPAALTGALAAFLFWRWLKSPSWGKAVLAGSALGLAELTKMSWLALFGLWLLLWLFWDWPGRRELSLRDWFRRMAQVGIVLVVGLLFLNIGYGFQGWLQPLGQFEFISGTLGAPGTFGNCRVDPGNRFRDTCFGALRVPLPRNYVSGFDIQKQDFEIAHLSYLAGQWQWPGSWCYYLYAMAIKEPLGMWCMAVMAFVLTMCGRGCSASWRDEMVVLAPLFVILILVSSQTGFSVHSRYLIPALPFLFVWVSKVARAFEIRWEPRPRNQELRGTSKPSGRQKTADDKCNCRIGDCLVNPQQPGVVSSQLVVF